MKDNAPLIQGEILMLLQDLDFETVRTTEGKRALIEMIDAGVRELFQKRARALGARAGGFNWVCGAVTMSDDDILSQEEKDALDQGRRKRRCGQ